MPEIPNNLPPIHQGNITPQGNKTTKEASSETKKINQFALQVLGFITKSVGTAKTFITSLSNKFFAAFDKKEPKTQVSRMVAEVKETDPKDVRDRIYRGAGINDEDIDNSRMTEEKFQEVQDEVFNFLYATEEEAKEQNLEITLEPKNTSQKTQEPEEPIVSLDELMKQEEPEELDFDELMKKEESEVLDFDEMMVKERGFEMLEEMIEEPPIGPTELEKKAQQQELEDLMKPEDLSDLAAENPDDFLRELEEDYKRAMEKNKDIEQS